MVLIEQIYEGLKSRNALISPGDGILHYIRTYVYRHIKIKKRNW